MPDTTDAVVLTDAQAFHEARLLIERAEKEVWSRFQYDMNPHDAYDLGKLHEALGVAADAIFNALNVAANHCGCSASSAAIESWYARDKAVA